MKVMGINGWCLFDIASRPTCSRARYQLYNVPLQMWKTLQHYAREAMHSTSALWAGLPASPGV